MNRLSQTDLWVIGQGAIGSTIGAYAQKHGSMVNFVGRSSQGVSEVKHLNGDKSHLPSPVTWKQLEQQKPVIKKALVSVKAPQVLNAITDLLPFLPKSNAHIILCHNGMGTIEEVLPLLKQHFVYFCTTSLGALKQGSLVQETGLGLSQWSIINTPLVSGADAISPFNQTDMAKLIPYAQFSSDIYEILWRKLAVNSVINPITAIHDIDNGEVLAEKFRSKRLLIIKELVAVANTQQVSLSVEDLVALVEEVAQKTAQNHSSMRQDINAGRTTEVDFISGYIAKLGRQHGIETPANDEMIASIYKLQTKKDK